MKKLIALFAFVLFSVSAFALESTNNFTVAVTCPGTVITTTNPQSIDMGTVVAGQTWTGTKDATWGFQNRGSLNEGWFDASFALTTGDGLINLAWTVVPTDLTAGTAPRWDFSGNNKLQCNATGTLAVHLTSADAPAGLVAGTHTIVFTMTYTLN
jgi:formylmethanofuran dehydrogenase subunit A